MRTCSYPSTTGPRSLAQPGVSASFPPQQPPVLSLPGIFTLCTSRSGQSSSPPDTTPCFYRRHTTAVVLSSLAVPPHGTRDTHLPSVVFATVSTHLLLCSFLLPWSSTPGFSLVSATSIRLPPAALSLASVWSPLPTLTIT